MLDPAGKGWFARFRQDILSPKRGTNYFGKGGFLGKGRHLLSANTTAGQLTGSKIKTFYGEIEFIMLGQIPKGNQLIIPLVFMFIIKGLPKLPTSRAWGALMVY